MRTCVRTLTHPPFIRAKARELRLSKSLTVDEIAERLLLPRTTVHYWTQDLPLLRSPLGSSKAVAARLRAADATRLKHQRLREQAYRQGIEEFDRLSDQETFRDFVCLYHAEGYKRDRNRVSICNSDPAIVKLAAGWVSHLSARKVTYSIQHHADQRITELRSFWGHLLGVDAGAIALQRKSNSNQLAGRAWRSEHGVLTVTSCDTYLRARLQAWMDRVRSDWV